MGRTFKIRRGNKRYVKNIQVFRRMKKVLLSACIFHLLNIENMK